MLEHVGTCWNMCLMCLTSDVHRARQMHGNGSMTWPDGRFYKGGFVEDRKSGDGNFTWPDGRQNSGRTDQTDQAVLEWESVGIHGSEQYSTYSYLLDLFFCILGILGILDYFV